jgi:hypothetical protein
MKFRNFLNEAKITSKEKNMVEKLIKRPKKTSFVLKSQVGFYDEDEVTVEASPNRKKGITFIYNDDLFNFTNLLVDMVDNMEDYTFKTDVERPTNTIYFEIAKK